MRRCRWSQSAQLEVSISGGGLTRAGELQLHGGHAQWHGAFGQLLQQIVKMNFRAADVDSELFVEVETDATSESGVSLVLLCPRRGRSRRIGFRE